MSGFDVAFGWAWLIPTLTAVAFVIVGVGGRRMARLEWGGWVAVAFSFAAMVVGILVAIGEMLAPGSYTDSSVTWISIPGSPGTFPNGVQLDIGILVDPISALMLLVVTVVGFLVLLYSIEYMHHDSGLARYYAELSLFLTAMTGLVLSDNLLEFFLFWELVGVCSYFLIGFYYEKPSAASAAKEAFLVTRVGDVLFLLGIFIYFAVYATSGSAPGWAAGGFKFTNGSAPFLAGAMGGNTPLLTVAGLMMLGGAAGKSAQFPLHVWLPDAMEGPTTVSALIHAATMVAAGVYLLAVVSLFLGFTPTDQLAIVAVGGFTTFFAATMAVVNPDIKRVIAYSTISQLGYMVFAVGAGFTMVGLYHLFTHAFFKALLFLAAGSVIHAVGTQDLFKMGGLRKTMPLTAAAFAIGALSLSGFPGSSGFFSKDDILGSVYATLGTHPQYWPFFLLALLTVFLTAYYIFRAWFLAFGGDGPRDATLPHAHEPGWTMRLPLVVLSALAIGAGALVFDPAFASLLPGIGVPPTFRGADLALSAVSVGLVACGFGLAYSFWGGGRVFELSESTWAARVRALLLHRYYFKAGYDWIGLRATYTVARAADFVERYVIDGTVRGFERLFAGLSDGLRRVQTGVVSDYAAYVVGGLVGFLLLLVFLAPWLLQTVGGG
ncbi:MAG: NADH-quinone oxidoreductase subunit L [Thermoplasmata archaeon]|nr:NADH-quinone oxidoreductase subunit L [Thermoplasmata archaeon]MCI4359005.1 NADH-quinone oxidoreductase subunit L [Thermoplasmata archaeon]